MKSALAVSTRLELTDIPVNTHSDDIWERVGDHLIWSRRLSWHWWRCLTLNFSAVTLSPIRAALVAEQGEAAIAKAETLPLPRTYPLPVGAANWRIA